MGNYRKIRIEYIPESKNAGVIKIIFIIFIIFLLIISILLLISMDFLSYLFPPKTMELNVSIVKIPQYNNSSSGAVQFYPNMKFNHNNLSYWIDENCTSDKRKRMIKSFELISNDVSFLTFFEKNENNPDIDIVCSRDEKYNGELTKDNEFFIAGEGGAKEIIQTERYNVINKGVILLYENPSNSIDCDWPNTEVHELMHVFGFNHSNDKKSLMYPYLDNCDQKLDDSIIRELNLLYSEDNLADLYFENISAIKKGRYLDFNFTIKNSGDMDAINVSYSILEDLDVTETKEINNIKYGAGIIVSVTNLKLNNKDSLDIRIVIDYFNRINEIDKDNNIALFRF